MRPPPCTPPLRTLLLLTVLLFAVPPPAVAKRRKGRVGGKGNGQSKSEHASLVSERGRLLAALAKIEQGCDSSAERSPPRKPTAHPALQQAQLNNFAQRGYTIVRGLVPSDVAIGLCPFGLRAPRLAV